jgi:ubiquinone/menaquinone biosynthesis C-methylase UbiE
MNLTASPNALLKQRIKEHWEKESCGLRNGASTDRRRFFQEIDEERYRQEPMIPSIAQFAKQRGKRVLEVGLGTGSDFMQWVRAGADAYGRDLTEASVRTVKERLQIEALTANVALGDAESLSEFPDNYFDVYYSWGVLMATPDTEKAISEAYRVLKPGGSLIIMLYHYPSVGVYLVWAAQGLLRFKFKSPRACYFDNVESPGMKMYSTKEGRALVGKYFKRYTIEVKTYLGAGDLLTQRLSPRYRAPIWRIAQKIYPRWFVKRVLGDRFGTELTIATIK